MTSGVVLWFDYRPTTAQSWGEIAALHSGVRPGLRASVVHAAIARALLPVGLAVAVTGVGAARAAGRLGALRLLPVVLVVAGGISGVLIAWDQLALWAVTVGSDLSGMGILFTDQLRFALVDGAEISIAAIRAWTVVHVVVGVLLAIAVGSPLVRLAAARSAS